MNQLNQLQIIKSSEYDMNSDNFQFMGVQSMDELLNKHFAYKESAKSLLEQLVKNAGTIRDTIDTLKYLEGKVSDEVRAILISEQEILKFTFENTYEIAKEAILGKEEKGN